MSWHHCEACEADNDMPTIEQVITDSWSCCQCGTPIGIGQYEQETVMTELYERFLLLEQTVKTLLDKAGESNVRNL